MLRNLSKWVLLCAIVFNLPAAYSADWYFGVGAGTSSYDTQGDITAAQEELIGLVVFPGIQITSISVDDSDSAFKVFAGFPFNENFGFEFGYVDLGEVTGEIVLTADNTFFAGEGTITSSASLGFSGFNAGFVGTLPVSDLVSINGRAGVYLWDVDLDVSAAGTGVFDGPDEFYSYSASDDGNDIYYGVGLNVGWFGVFYDVYDIDGEDVDFAGVSASFGLN